MVQKLHICEKVYFDQLLDFPILQHALSIPSHFIIVSYARFFQCNQGVKQLDPDQARDFVGPDLGANCLHRLLVDNKSLP